tara:strand:- start:21 stop:1955 length:1935 start_codon:yes stop_codon:yes gene_type:complete
MPKENIDDWKAKISHAREEHEKVMEKPTKLFRNYYKGSQWTHMAEDSREMYNNEIVDNMVFTAVQTIKPSIAQNRPKIFAKPRKSQFFYQGQPVDSSILVQRVEILSQFLFEELNVKGETDKAIIDALICPVGYIMVGYDLEVLQDEISPGTFLDRIEEESIFVQRVSPLDVLRDPSSKDHNIDHDDWIAIKWQKTVKELQDDPTLKNTRNIQVNVDIREDTSKFSKVDTRMGGNPKELVREGSESFGRVEGWDIWDKKNQRLIVFVEGHEKFLRDTPWPLDYGNSYPLESVWFNYNPDETYPVADTAIYQAKQDFLNRFESKMVDHVGRISDRKYAYDDKRVKPDEVEKWAHGPSGSAIKTKGDPNTAIAVVKDATISQDMYQTVGLIKQDIMRQVGIAQFEAGGAEKLQTAQEGQLINQGISSRRAERSMIVERFLSNVIKKMLKIAQQTLPVDSEIPVTQDQAQSISQDTPQAIRGKKFPFMAVDREMISGEYTFGIEVGSTQPTNEQERLQKAGALVQFAQTNPLIDKTEVTKLALEWGGFGSYISRLMRDPQQVQQEQQQAQQAQMEAALAEPRLKTQTDLQKTQLKTQTDVEVARIKGGVDGRKGAMASADKGADREVKVMDILMKAASDRQKSKEGN